MNSLTIRPRQSNNPHFESTSHPHPQSKSWFMQSKWKTGKYNAHIYQGPRQHKTATKKNCFLPFFLSFFFSQLTVAQMIFPLYVTDPVFGLQCDQQKSRSMWHFQFGSGRLTCENKLDIHFFLQCDIKVNRGIGIHAITVSI